MLWRIMLLNRMGLPLPGLKNYEELEKFSLPPQREIEAIKTKGRLLFHLGKYKESALLLQKEAEKARKIDKIEEADLILHASTSYRNYWNLSKASQCLDTAKKIIETVNGEEKDWLNSRLHMCRAGKLYFEYSLLKIIPLIGKVIRKKIYEEYCKACKYAAESGNWTDFYQAALWSKGVNIDIAELTREMGYIPPPDPAEGYKYLSFYLPRVIETRNKLSQKKGPLQQGEREELENHIQTCKDTGNIPEVWKLLVTKMKRQPLREGVINDFLQFLHYYRACEYSFFFKLFLPLAYLRP